MPICVRATRHLATIEDREDAIQDALLAIWEQGLANYADTMGGWIYNIARRRAHRYMFELRRRNKYISKMEFDHASGGFFGGDDSGDTQTVYPRSLQDWDDVESQELQADIQARKQLGRLLWAKMPQLSKSQRNSIMLLMMGCTYKEAAWVLGVGVGNITTSIAYAQRKLLQRLPKHIVQEQKDARRRGYHRGLGWRSKGRQFKIDENGIARYIRPTGDNEQNETKERLLPDARQSDRDSDRGIPFVQGSNHMGALCG